jgi:hypothetical protein
VSFLLNNVVKFSHKNKIKRANNHPFFFLTSSDCFCYFCLLKMPPKRGRKTLSQEESEAKRMEEAKEQGKKEEDAKMRIAGLLVMDSSSIQDKIETIFRIAKETFGGKKKTIHARKTTAEVSLKRARRMIIAKNLSRQYKCSMADAVSITDKGIFTLTTFEKVIQEEGFNTNFSVEELAEFRRICVKELRENGEENIRESDIFVDEDENETESESPEEPVVKSSKRRGRKK